ncbi:unnamed protein product, partial [Meganyctiphanes norvegica]
HQGSEDIFWEGQIKSVENAWIDMAKLFVSYRCDPRIPNHQNILPHDLAEKSECHKMAAYLEKEYKERLREPIDHASAAAKNDELIEAARENNIEKITKLLKNHVPMLPISAEKDPLVEAIRNGCQNAVFFLICAGTPICNCSIDDLTPLEAAHNTLGLPAIFPAMMRKIYSDRLIAERSKIPQSEDLHLQLAEGLDNIQKSILEKGDKSRWHILPDSGDRSKQARKILVDASELGLSLTVQLLGLEDFELRPNHNEASPIEKAQEKDHYDTLYALCRDLKLCPYAKLRKSNEIMERLEEDLCIAECIIFKKYAPAEYVLLLLDIDEDKVQDFLEQALKP